MTRDIFRSDIMPANVARLPRDVRGYPVPWFVAWFDGEPDFRVMDSPKLSRAYRDRICWVCGHKLPRLSAFVIGPMCAVNRVASEPTSHVECAEYSAQACPFLSNPRRHRPNRALPEETRDPAGVGIMRNPGVALVWIVSGRIKPFQVPAGLPKGNQGLLFNIGTPVEAKWYAHGRAATRDEVEAALESGLPTLMDHAPTPQAKAVLSAHLSHARRYLPAA